MIGSRYAADMAAAIAADVPPAVRVSQEEVQEVEGCDKDVLTRLLSYLEERLPQVRVRGGRSGEGGE